MPKKLISFFKIYKQLGFVVVAVVVSAFLDIFGKDSIAHIILAITAIISVLPLAWGMVEAFRDGSYGLDILALTAIVTSVILNEYWAAIIIVLMLTGGEALEDYAERRAKKELTILLDRKPKKAHLVKGNNIVDISVSDIKVGDKLKLLPGEVVPVDSVVIEGSSSLDESSLTGESLPIGKDEGDELLSGSINVEGAIIIKALHTAKDSQYEQIIKLAKSAQVGQSPFVKLADRYSVPFTAISFLIAGSVWVISGDPVRFLEVLVVATPCPLLLGAPIALISGMSRSAKHGIIVKTGSSLEKLAAIKTIAFDKTGTLTNGIPVVSGVKTFNKFTKNEVLNAAASLEINSTHILASAIIDAVDNKITPAKQIKEISGRGLKGRLKGQTLVLGRSKFLEDENITIPSSATKVTSTSTFVAINGKLAGVISFKDETRAESKDTLLRLKSLGVKNSLMVTGDNLQTANLVAKNLGINKVVADCLPGDKIHAIEQVEHLPVAFVGDGVNDAPVLTAADVGIAIGAKGNTAASESADIVIMNNDISKVAEVFEISRRTFAIGKQSILIGIFISFALMGVFATGRFKPVQGAIIQELVDVTVIVNALRAHSGGRKKSK